MRAIRIHHEPCFLRERDGVPTDRACIHVIVIRQNVFAHSRALSCTFAHLRLDCIFYHSYGMFNCPLMYSTVHQRPSKATFTS